MWAGARTKRCILLGLRPREIRGAEPDASCIEKNNKLELKITKFSLFKCPNNIKLLLFKRRIY